MNKHEIDFKQGYGTADTEWLEKIDKIISKLQDSEHERDGRMTLEEADKEESEVKDEPQNISIKKVKGFSSMYPNICDLKLLPNVDGTWITIQDDIGTSMTIKLSDLNDFIYYDKKECPYKAEKEE